MSTEDDPPPLPQKTVKAELIPPPLPPPIITDNHYQAINFSVNYSPEPQDNFSRSAFTTPILARQNYDTVIKPRRSYLYSSLPPDNIAAAKKGFSVVKKERAPTPPPKKRTNPAQNWFLLFSYHILSLRLRNLFEMCSKGFYCVIHINSYKIVKYNTILHKKRHLSFHKTVCVIKNCVILYEGLLYIH